MSKPTNMSPAVQFRLSPELHEALLEEAALEGLNGNAWARRIITVEINNRRAARAANMASEASERPQNGRKAARRATAPK